MPSLLLYFGAQELGRYELKSEKTVVGRDQDCDVCLEHSSVSRVHCRLLWENQQYVVTDAGSSNGTFVNGKRTDRQVLADGDQILVGGYVLVFEAATGGGLSGVKEEAAPESDHTKVEDAKEIRRRIARFQAARQPGAPGASEGDFLDQAVGTGFAGLVLAIEELVPC